jgi:hypothetical protein
MRTVCVSVALLSLLLPDRLYASELMELTLSCDGKMMNMMADNNPKTESVTKMGLLVDLRQGTVLGFGHPARIKSSDAASVDFEGPDGSVQGTIDRITGSVQATTTLMSRDKSKLLFSYNWDLHCIPVKRVF